MSKKKALGRGLSSFLSEGESFISNEDSKNHNQLNLPIEYLKPNPDQPRKYFNEEELKELSETISDKGILQPVIVTKQNDTNYIIVAGERRWRAAQLAQIHELPVIIKSLTDQEIIEISIIENVQRSQLKPLEESAGYSRLVHEYEYSHEKIAKLVGKSRPYISNSLRLLSLPQEVKKFIKTGDLTSGHARALLNCENPISLSNLIVKKGLSVRQTELLAKRNRIEIKQNQIFSVFKDPDTKEMENNLSAHLKFKVNIISNKKKKSGKISISFGNNEEFQNICKILKKQF